MIYTPSVVYLRELPTPKSVSANVLFQILLPLASVLISITLLSPAPYESVTPIRIYPPLLVYLAEFPKS